MADLIERFPAQVEEAWRIGREAPVQLDVAGIQNVIIQGMGGSAIGGDLVRSLVQEESEIPVIVHRDYGLPAFVDGNTLLIAASYSGNTEETLSGFEAALETGARKLVMTTGGKLAQLAEKSGIPVFKIEYKAQPRAALGFSFIPALGVMQKLGFIGDKSADVAETVAVLEQLSAKLDEKSAGKANPAKQLAQRLYGNLPVIYGAGIAAEAAHRWKPQINENGKAWAFYEVFPELNHNATVGYPLPKEVASGIRVIMLRSPTYNARVRLRYEVTAGLLKQAGVAYEHVDAAGNSPLAQMVSLVMIGDFVSYYLAILYGVDPSPVKAISYLKEQMAKG